MMNTGVQDKRLQTWQAAQVCRENDEKMMNFTLKIMAVFHLKR